MNGRLTRRMVGWLRARKPDLKLGSVADPRRRHGQRWSLEALLGTVLVGLLAGRRSLAEVEALTEEMSPAARRALGIGGRIPDTTLRDALVQLGACDLRAVLARGVHAAHRRKALEPEGLPWGVASLDGKATAIQSWDHKIAQQQGDHGVVRTMTATLVSSAVRVCLDAYPIPAQTNEMGVFPEAVKAITKAYRGTDLFRAVMCDAGACSERNARFVREQGLHYVMVLNEAQPTLAAEAQRVLGGLDDGQALVAVEDHRERVRHTIWLTEELNGFLDWSHLWTVLRVRREVLDAQGRAQSTGERYFITSLRPAALTPPQWETLLRARWGVENNCHHTFDTAFAEDDKPWFHASPTAVLAIILLRRIAYNLMALFRGHSLRGELTRLTPWLTLIRWTYNALIVATDAALVDLRPRAPP